MITLLLATATPPDDAIVLNERNGLTLCEVLADEVTPETIGAWNMDGTVAIPLNLATYLELAPDEATYDADGNETSRTRPTVYKQTHQWAGWGERQ